MKRGPFFFLSLGNSFCASLKVGPQVQVSLICHAQRLNAAGVGTSVFEALMVQFPASLAGSRISIKDALSPCAGELCTVLFPMSLKQEGLWHHSTAGNAQWPLRGVLEAIWLPQWNHGQRGQMFERSSREESSA